MKLLFENLQTFMTAGAGAWDIPAIEPTKMVPECEWIGFNYANQYASRGAGYGVHFFLDDEQFLRVWNRPDKYAPIFRRYKCVCSPDFSMYTDMPRALQIYNHYRKHWCAAYWQELGLTVIPTISWSDKNSFAWCFDGEPRESVVAIGTTGTQQSAKTRAAFLDGYYEMQTRLSPTQILVYGVVPTELESDNIIKIGDYSAAHFKKEAR